MHRRLMLALAPALALSSAAFAQAPGPMPGHPPGMRHPPSAEMKAMHEAAMKQHIEDLKTILRLRPDQEPALQAFVAAHQPPDRDDMPRMGGAQASEALTTPQRLDRMAKRESEMAARHAQMRQAMSKFYAALSPDQQKVFDALMRLDGPGRMGNHMGMMIGGHMGMMGGPMMQRRMMMHGPGGDMPGHEPD